MREGWALVSDIPVSNSGSLLAVLTSVSSSVKRSYLPPGFGGSVCDRTSITTAGAQPKLPKTVTIITGLYRCSEEPFNCMQVCPFIQQSPTPAMPKREPRVGGSLHLP